MSSKTPGYADALSHRESPEQVLVNEKKDEVESFDVYGENEGESASECYSASARFIVLVILMLARAHSQVPDDGLVEGGRADACGDRLAGCKSYSTTTCV